MHIYIRWSLIFFGMLLAIHSSSAKANFRDSTTFAFSDSTMLDSSQQKEAFFLIPKLFRKENGEPVPSRALKMSFLLPGSGQLYNGRWWKFPIVAGAIGGMAYLVNKNNNEYILLKRSYRRAVQGYPYQTPDLEALVGNPNTATLKVIRDSAAKNRDLAYIGFFAVYTLVAVEAFVDAHLMDFDISEDLSLQMKGKINTTLGIPEFAICFNWH